jgi:MFS transporter, ACS family, hexuronate transporter
MSGGDPAARVPVQPRNSLEGPFEPARPRRLRWLMIAFAFVATVINYLDRQTLSVAAPAMREQLHFGDLEYSRMVSAFLLAYTIMNGVSGPIIDRLGTRWGYAWCMLWWSAAGAAHALARSALSLGAFRFLLGMGEAGNYVAAVKIVSEWFPVRERALASGIFNSGAAIGSLVSTPLIAYLVAHYGWPSAFLAVGALGFAWLIAWLPTYRTPPEAALETKQPPVPPWNLFRQKFVWSLTLAKVFFDPVWYFYVFWFPQFLSTVHHFDLATIGLYGWIPFLTAAIGNLAGGTFSAVMLRRGSSLLTARRVSLSLFASLMTAAIPAVLAHSPLLAIACVSVATFGYTGCLVNMLPLPADYYPQNVLGSIWGLASMGSGFGGMVFTLLTGEVLVRFSYTPVFFGFGIMPLICVAILLFVTTAVKTDGGAMAAVSPNAGVKTSGERRA